MGGTSMTNQTPGRRTRIAAQRAAARKARTRNRLTLAGVAIIAVIAVIVAFVVLQGSGSSPTSRGPTPPTGQALNRVAGKVAGVPASTSDAVGAGQVTSPPKTIQGPPLTGGGHPEVLYLGAEYCPYCAAERWAMIAALSRFGTFTGLAATHSAAKDGAGHAEPFPNTPTFTFAHSQFRSRYLTFTPVETNTNIPDPSSGGYTTLQNPNAAQQALLSKYDQAYQGAIPFLDLGNRYLSVGASYDPSVLNGLTWDQIAAGLHNPSSPVAKGVLGSANYLTAAMCGLTHNQPSSACTPAVRALHGRI